MHRAVIGSLTIAMCRVLSLIRHARRSLLTKDFEGKPQLAIEWHKTAGFPSGEMRNDNHKSSGCYETVIDSRKAFCESCSCDLNYFCGLQPEANVSLETRLKYPKKEATAHV